MAKVAFVLVLALIAVQFAESATLGHRFGNGETIKSLQDGGIEDLIELFETLVKQIDEIISELVNHFPASLEGFTDKINEIFAEINITELIAVFREEILTLTENGAKDPTNCGAIAEKTVDSIATEITSDFDKCNTDIQLVVNKIGDLIEFKMQKALALKEELIKISLNCMANNEDRDDILKCLETEVEHAIKQVGELIDEIKKAFPIIISTAHHGIDTFEKCMKDVKVYALARSAVMVGDLDTCMRN